MHQINVLRSVIFFKTISEELNGLFTLSDFSVIAGRDFNVIFEQWSIENEILNQGFRRDLFGA